MSLRGLKKEKSIIFHKFYIILSPLSPAFFKRLDSDKNLSWKTLMFALISQRFSALWLAEYLKQLMTFHKNASTDKNVYWEMAPISTIPKCRRCIKTFL